MRYIARSIVIKVIGGLLLGVLMFYFRQAHAAICTAADINSGKATSNVVASYTLNGYGFTPRCAIGTNYRSLAEMQSGCFVLGDRTTNQTAYISVLNPVVISSGSVTYNIARVSDNGNIGQIFITATVTCSENCSSRQGTVAGTGSMTFDGLPSRSICSNGCTAMSTVTGGTVGVCLGNSNVCSTGSGVASTEWLYTGQACFAPTPQLDQTLKNVDKFTITPSPSAAATLTASGEPLTTPTPNIQILGNGDAIVRNGTPSPPGPNNGTPGTPGTPNSTVTITNNNTSNTFNYFTVTNLNRSNTSDGSLGGPLSPGEPPTDEPPTEGAACTPGVDCPVQCGGAGMPACEVSIDETGTPTQGTPLDEVDLEAGRAAASAQSTGVEGWNLPSLTELQYGACQSITLIPPPNLANALGLNFGGVSMELPGPIVCPEIDKLKYAAGWAMALLLAIGASLSIARAAGSRSSPEV